MLTVRETAAILGMSRQGVINMLNPTKTRPAKMQGNKLLSPNASGYYWLIPESEIQRVKDSREGK